MHTPFNRRDWRSRLRIPRVVLAALLLASVAHATEPALLAPGEFEWRPELAPNGPVVVVISLPEQLAHVYRNGVRIGMSTVSTGREGYETPTGVFTILEKKREHYSNLYDDAPMPYMQRLTWDGIALHAGSLPGYPASHGCVRLPKEFAEKLFATTASGMTVVVADTASHSPTVAYPGWFAPVQAVTGVQPAAPAGADEFWDPGRAPYGPVVAVLSLRDQKLVVLRQGVEIGHAPARWIGEVPAGTRTYVLLEGDREGENPLVPGRPARRWLQLPTAAGPTGDAGLGAAIRSGRLSVSPDFAARVDDALSPGATVVITDESLQANQDTGPQALLESEPGPGPEPLDALTQ